MPNIYTPNGKIKYKTIPLYPGVKKIDKEVALDNLKVLKHILDSNGIKFFLSFGTLLGAVREHDFIEHDEDIDLTLKEEQRNLFLKTLPELFNEGFSLVRFDRNGLYSLMRNNEYIDFYFYKLENGGIRTCGGSILLDIFFSYSSNIQFHNMTFATHSNYMEFLKFVYGDSWMIPKVYNDYEKPKWKRNLFCIKEYLKDYLPDWLYNILAKPSKKKMRKRGMHRMQRYYESNNLQSDS